MKYIKADILNDSGFELWKTGFNNPGGEDILIKDINDIPDEYIIEIIKCEECDNWDDSWTQDMHEDVGYCPVNDTFWFQHESCSRGELKNGNG